MRILILIVLLVAFLIIHYYRKWYKLDEIISVKMSKYRPWSTSYWTITNDGKYVHVAYVKDINNIITKYVNGRLVT